jgi:phage terminase Nu1 subunit (DNA packaging protein)
VALLEQVLATVGRSIVGVLEPLHVNLHRQCPALTAEDLKLIQTEISRACDIAVQASLAMLDAEDEAEAAAAPGPEVDAAAEAEAYGDEDD